MTTISIQIPDDILDNFENIEAIEKAVYEDFVIEQRQNGNISLGRAAKLLGIKYSDFFDLLGKKGLSYINASVDELDESHRNFKEVLRNKS
jgi:predicted HTH domain antitoxin